MYKCTFLSQALTRRQSGSHHSLRHRSAGARQPHRQHPRGVATTQLSDGRWCLGDRYRITLEISACTYNRLLTIWWGRKGEKRGLFKLKKSEILKNSKSFKNFKNLKLKSIFAVCMLFVFGTLLEFAIAKFIRHLQDIDYLKRKKVMKFDPNAAQNNSKSVQLKKYEYYVKENYPKVSMNLNS